MSANVAAIRADPLVPASAARPPMSGILDLPTPHLLFMGDVTEPGYAKTAFGLCDWARDKCLGECVTAPDAVSAGLPRMTPVEAAVRGARAMVVAVATPSDVIPPQWCPSLVEALDAGLDLVGGMHTRLAEFLGLAEAAERRERRLIDVRVPPPDIAVGTGRKRTGKRLFTVGTDCALGKNTPRARLPTRSPHGGWRHISAPPARPGS